MTLCIAAIAREKSTIIFVSDYMLSNETHSIEGNLAKLSMLDHGTWMQLFSGDPSHNLSVLERVRVGLKGKPEDRETLLRTYEQMFQQELKQKAESQLLSPLGMDRDEFLSNGRAKLGDEQFSRLLYQLQHMGLETEFLIGGFDGKLPHIFSINDPGTAYIREALSFHAIGCGAALADAFLMTLPYDPFDPLETIIYRILETKFKSEAAPGVGKRTTLATMDSDGTFKRYLTEEIQKIRDVWEANKAQPLPKEAIDVIKDLRPAHQSKLSKSSSDHT